MAAVVTPKYDMEAAGNGMHLHISTRDATTNEPNFCNGSALTSKRGESFVEAILQHLPGLMGLTLPTVNSFRRIGPRCWTGSVVGWAVEDKECGVRVIPRKQNENSRHEKRRRLDSTDDERRI